MARGIIIHLPGGDLHRPAGDDDVAAGLHAPELHGRVGRGRVRRRRRSLRLWALEHSGHLVGIELNGRFFGVVRLVNDDDVAEQIRDVCIFAVDQVAAPFEGGLAAASSEALVLSLRIESGFGIGLAVVADEHDPGGGDDDGSRGNFARRQDEVLDARGF